MKKASQTSRLCALALATSVAVLAVGCGKTVDDTTTGMANTPAPAPMEPAQPVGTAGTIGAKIDDTVLTTSVKTALLKEPEIKSMDIQVETRNGEVMLSGFVDSQVQKDRAVAVARGVDGVMGVQDSLALKAGGSTTVGAKMDDGITTTKVKAALLADSSVKGSDINVETQNGVVQLSGFVDSQTQVDRALQLARDVQGVTKVDNELTVKK